MGLDDFMDLDENSESNNRKQTNNNTELELNSYKKSTDNKIQPKGPIGFTSIEDYEDTINGSIEIPDNLIKSEMPIFPHIVHEDDISELDMNGQAYTNRFIINNEAETACVISYTISPLDSVPRELLMIDTGKVVQSECLNVLSERTGRELSWEDTVYVLILGKTVNLAKLAIANSETDNLNTHTRKKILKAVYGSSYAHALIDDTEPDVSSLDITSISEWDRG